MKVIGVPINRAVWLFFPKGLSVRLSFRRPLIMVWRESYVG